MRQERGRAAGSRKRKQGEHGEFFFCVLICLDMSLRQRCEAGCVRTAMASAKSTAMARKAFMVVGRRAERNDRPPEQQAPGQQVEEQRLATTGPASQNSKALVCSAWCHAQR